MFLVYLESADTRLIPDVYTKKESLEFLMSCI